jgi:hypothetical protein
MANNRASHHSRVGGISVYRLVELCLAQMLGCPGGGGSEDTEKGGGIREAPRVLMTTVSRFLISEKGYTVHKFLEHLMLK